MGVAGAWDLPLIAVGVGFHLAVSWALLWRYFQARERSLLIWGIAWLILAIHVLGMFLTHLGTGASAQILRDMSFAGAALAFFAGQVEMEGRAFRHQWSLAAGASVLVGVALVIGALLDAPVTLAATTVVMLCMGASAWITAPLGPGKRDITRWLLFSGYLAGALHAAIYLMPHGVMLEIGGHALFSLLVSAAVTWQAWEHERAVRLFSRTLERLNRPLTTQEALDESLRLVSDVLHVTHGWIILREAGRGDAAGHWTIGAATGFPDWTRHGLYHMDFPIDTCLCLRPMDKEALVKSMADLPCVRFSEEAGRPAGRHVTIPLGSDGQVQGIMSLVIPSHRFFAPADVEMLTAMGEQIGLALDRARLYDELRAKEEARGRLLAQLITAQEDERRRIARELHDETGQALTALVVNLDFLVRHPVDEALLHQRLAGVRDMAEATLAEVRRVIHEMRPSVLDDLGLEAAIRWLVKRYEPSGVKICLELKGLEQRLPGHIEITAFRLVQEAATNTVKHAAAGHLQIRVMRKGQWLTVEVADDGQGIDPARLKQPTGMGLVGLKERVALAGGTLSVESTPGAGTRVTAHLPIGKEATDDGDPGADLRRPHDGEAGRPHGAAVGAGH
jgi:signal transduction histidine kinase